MRLNESLKRAIYSDIMNDVARVIKKRVNEDNDNYDYNYYLYITEDNKTSDINIPTIDAIQAACICYFIIYAYRTRYDKSTLKFVLSDSIKSSCKYSTIFDKLNNSNNEYVNKVKTFTEILQMYCKSDLNTVIKYLMLLVKKERIL